MNKPEASSPWSQAFVWLWYNDPEIFSFTQEDFDNKAKQLKERGVTIALTFSLTHFRLGFYPYWEQIHECLRKMVLACHKYGIRVVEHHSSHLTHNLSTKQGWERFEADIETFGAGSCSYDNWRKVYPFITSEPVINGVDIRTFSQIDGRTGKEARNMYGCYSMCFNNPDYRRTYFNYLKSVVATGIDGIMNDDVQFFGDGNACTCPHCRRLFLEETGYELPGPEGWESFFGHYENPAYVAWVQFKKRSTERFYRDLTALYRSWGLSLLRPNYSSDVLSHNITCYGFDRCCDIWDFIFQENCFSTIIKQSYLHYWAESVHRFAAAQRTGVPSMSMFYPDRRDTAYFGWALARSWGQLYTGTCEGFDITAYERPYREFEARHIGAYTDPQKLADVSFYFSTATRDLVADAMEKHMQPFIAGLQAAYACGLGVDMVFETDGIGQLQKHRRIVLSHLEMAADEELGRLREYVQSGGELLILGRFAALRPDGSARSEEEARRLIGLTDAVEAEGRGSSKRFLLGKGAIWTNDFTTSAQECAPPIWSMRRQKHPPKVNAVPAKWELYRQGTGRVLCEMVGSANVRLSGENERVLATAYRTQEGLAVHLVNLADTIAEQPRLVEHSDLIPNFCEGAPKTLPLTLRLQNGCAQGIARAVLATPENERETELAVSHGENGVCEISVPGGLFSGYALLRLS